MPIEFQCSNCQTILRTPDDSAGKSARCPGCSNVQPIPGSSGPSGIPDAVPVGAPSPQNPFAKPTSSASPHGNPYAPTGTSRPAMDARVAQARVQPAAITWLVVSILLSLMYLLGIIGGIVNIATEGAMAEDIGTMIGFVVALCLCVMGIAGAICMLRLQNRKLAIAGAICTILPGMACCFLPIGVSIWALVVLLDAEIKPYFS